MCIPRNKHEHNWKKVRLWIRNDTETQVTVLYRAMRISCDLIHVTLPNNIQLNFKRVLTLLTEHSVSLSLDDSKTFFRVGVIFKLATSVLSC